MPDFSKARLPDISDMLDVAQHRRCSFNIPGYVFTIMTLTVTFSNLRISHQLQKNPKFPMLPPSSKKMRVFYFHVNKINRSQIFLFLVCSSFSLNQILAPLIWNAQRNTNFCRTNVQFLKRLVWVIVKMSNTLIVLFISLLV